MLKGRLKIISTADGDIVAFALQGHDPKSKVFVKNIMVKPLP